MEPLLLYIDPGSGSLLVQSLIAAIVTAPFLFRRHVTRVIRAVRRPHTGAATAGIAAHDNVDRTRS